MEETGQANRIHASQETADLIKAAGKGHWLFTDFCQDESSGLNRRWLIRFLYGFFSVTCNLKIKQLPNFSTHFKSADLEKINEKFFLRGLLKSVLFRKN